MSIFTRDFGRARKVCCCDRLRINGLVKVIGWTPNAKVVTFGRESHVVTVRYETSTLRERDYDCYMIEPICPLEELAKLACE
jgi:hypothetical protein